VPTPALPRLPRAAVRLQLRLPPRAYAAADAAAVLERFAAEVERAIGARAGQLAPREAREGGKLLVLDLLPPTEVGAPTAELLLERLLGQVVGAAPTLRLPHPNPNPDPNPNQVAGAAPADQPGLRAVSEVARATADAADAPTVVLSGADIAARRGRHTGAAGGGAPLAPILGLAAGAAVIAGLYATQGRRKVCLRRARWLRQSERSSSLFASEGDDEGEEEDGEGAGDAVTPASTLRRGGGVTAVMQLRPEDVGADGRDAFELALPLGDLASVGALRAELRRRGAERTGRSIGGVSVSYVDEAGNTVPIDGTMSMLDVRVEAVSLVVRPSFL
jgi:hypothetical protein